MEAARNGDTTAVRAVLDKFNPDRKKVAFDAAHEACRGNHDECLTLLLPYVETTQMGFGMLLSECVHADHVACTEVLLQHWKSVCNNITFVPHKPTYSGDQRNDYPTMWSDPAVCRVLIDAGADVNTKNQWQQSPLHYACQKGALDVVKMLVEAGAGVRATDGDGDTCLHLAAKLGHIETVRYLVGLPEVELNQGDCCDFNALHYAVAEKRTDVVQVLIDAGSDFARTSIRTGTTALHNACCNGALDIVKMLVRAGAGVLPFDEEGFTCLMRAAQYEETETVRYLLSLPEVDVNQRNDYETHQRSETALYYVVDDNLTSMVQVLIDAGADIDAQNHEGCSPLHSACASGGLNVVKMLVEAGAGVRVTNDEGRTCLIFAARFGHTETVRYLVGLPEVELNHRDTANNNTALQYAEEEKHTDVAQVLLDALEAANSRASRLRPCNCVC